MYTRPSGDDTDIITVLVVFFWRLGWLTCTVLALGLHCCCLSLSYHYDVPHLLQGIQNCNIGRCETNGCFKLSIKQYIRKLNSASSKEHKMSQITNLFHMITKTHRDTSCETEQIPGEPNPSPIADNVLHSRGHLPRLLVKSSSGWKPHTYRTEMKHHSKPRISWRQVIV